MDGNGICILPVHGIRMNGVTNGITNNDGKYQEIIWKSDEYSSRLEELELPEDEIQTLFSFPHP